MKLFMMIRKDDSLILIIALSVVGVILLCIVGRIAYHFKEEHRKKRLAETWEQRVKEAAEEIEKSSKSPGGSGTLRDIKKEKSKR
ncbi:hypothetical protein GCK32_019433 [Trichostrongylus colubriformis]|uniref:Uncharacterized protein n=1 Tax=Trichostrongylus colubriformis TaxID=6319 RepID=A0AAN8FN12_TRICO